MRVYKRGAVWHCVFYDNERRRIRRSTGCTDKKAAETRARAWERDAADPDHATARDATLSQALTLYFESLEELVAAGKRSRATRDSYKSKAGHLVRIFESRDGLTYEPFRLATITTSDPVEQYIAQRRKEHASDSTIAKELVVLERALSVAKNKGLWHGDLDAVMPRFSCRSEPRTRFLTRDEVDRLMRKLRPRRAAVVAFIAATGAEWSAVSNAAREDVAPDVASVLVRGTKNKYRVRPVPIVSDDQRRLLEFTRKHAAGTFGALFPRWSNGRRDLLEACERAGIPPCSFHDLRRSFASWMLQDGVPPHLIAKMLGHRTSRMVEVVYGQIRPDDLGALVRAALARSM